eukprot:scaffold380491_cov22-Prasinocladus_malaysianus.AAC.1
MSPTYGLPIVGGIDYMTDMFLFSALQNIIIIYLRASCNSLRKRWFHVQSRLVVSPREPCVRPQSNWRERCWRLGSTYRHGTGEAREKRTDMLCERFRRPSCRELFAEARAVSLSARWVGQWPPRQVNDSDINISTCTRKAENALPDELFVHIATTARNQHAISLLKHAFIFDCSNMRLHPDQLIHRSS